jgi:hypothetical protein
MYSGASNLILKPDVITGFLVVPEDYNLVTDILVRVWITV